MPESLLPGLSRDHCHRCGRAVARMTELPTYTGSILAEHTLDEIELGGIGRILAVTPNDWVNVLAVHRFERIFGRANCFQLSPQQDASKKKRHQYLHGRWLFAETMTHSVFQRRFAGGVTVKATPLTEEFDYAAFLRLHGDSAVPMFLN